MTSASSHQPTTMYHDEIDEMKTNPRSAKAKKARRKLRTIAINDSDIWSEIQTEMRRTGLHTNIGIGEALSISMLDNLVDKLVASGSVKEKPHQRCKNTATEKGVLDFAKDKFGSEDFTSNWKSLKTFVCTNKSDPLAVESGNLRRKLGGRGRFCCANQITPRNVHSEDSSSASEIFRSKNELSAIKSEESFLDARKKSNSSTNVGNVRRKSVDTGITRDQSLRTLLELVLAAAADSKPECNSQCLDERSSIQSSPRKKSFEEIPHLNSASNTQKRDDYDSYVPFDVTSASWMYLKGIKERRATNHKRTTALRKHSKMASSRSKAASDILQKEFQ